MIASSTPVKKKSIRKFRPLPPADTPMVEVELLVSPSLLHGLIGYKRNLARLLDPSPAGLLAREAAKLFLSREFSSEGIGQDAASRANAGQAEASVRMIIEILDNPTKYGGDTANVLKNFLQVLSGRDAARLFDEITPPVQARRMTHLQRLSECEDLIRELATKHNERVEKSREREKIRQQQIGQTS